MTPLYSELMAQGSWGKRLAKQIYARARPGYHPVTVAAVDRLSAGRRIPPDAGPVIVLATRFIGKGSEVFVRGVFASARTCLAGCERHTLTFGGHMNFQAFTARFALLVACGLMTATPALADTLQCVPYARQVSGIDIHGNANTWWNQAKGKYERGHAPEVGAVLAFAAHGKMRMGHVAMVSKVVGDREVLLTHANWSRHGGIETDVRAVDVSDAGDWSEVKVWYAPLHDLGTTVYPTRGFIYADQGPDAVTPTLIAHGPTDARGIFTLVDQAAY